METVVIAIRSILTKIKTYPLARHAISTTFFSILGHSVGLFIPFFVASWYGVGYDTDAFFLAYSLILFITNIFAIAVEIGIVPFVAERKTRIPEKVGHFLGAFLSYSTMVMLGIAILYILIGKYFLSVVVRFDQSGIQLTYLLSLEILPLLILTTWSGILNGTLNAYKIFWLPAVSPSIRAICVLGFTFIARNTLGIHALALGYVVGESTRCLIALIVILHRRLLSLTGWSSMRTEVSQVFRILAFQILSMAIVGLNPLIDRSMASWLGIGNVSLLEYGEKLFYIPTTLLSVGFLTVVLSHWAEHYYTIEDNSLLSNNKNIDLAEQVKHTAKYLLIVCLLITVVIFVFRESLVTLAYGRGKFSEDNITKVINIFSIYLLGMVPYSLSHVFSRGILILKNTSTLAKVSTIKLLCNVIFNFIFIIWFGVIGIAVSSTITAFISLGLFFYYFHKLIKR